MTSYCCAALCAAAITLTLPVSWAAAQVTFTVEPSKAAGQVEFLKVAPGQAGGATSGLLCLRIEIKNGLSLPVALNTVKLAFGGNPADQSISAPPGVFIAGGDRRPWWHNLWPNSDCVTLPANPPATMTVTLSFNGLANVTGTYSLKADTTVFAFPGKHSDRPAGEFWKATSGTHGTGTEGSQLFAYDMGVIGFDTKKGIWSECFDGIDCNFKTNSSLKNKDYRIWGTPVYAMADGVVVEFMNNVATNTTLGGPNPGICGVQGAGNHFYVKQGNVTVLYAHMQPGTLNSSLLHVGAPVTKGTKLGLAGNAGSSTNPHLHVHAMVGAIATPPGQCLSEVTPLVLRPLPFSDASAVDISALNAGSLTGPWGKLNAEGPPAVASAICAGGATGPVPANVAALPGKIKVLRAEVTDLQQELQSTAGGSQKAAIASQIKHLLAQIASLKKPLDNFNAPRCPIDRVACSAC